MTVNPWLRLWMNVIAAAAIAGLSGLMTALASDAPVTTKQYIIAGVAFGLAFFKALGDRFADPPPTPPTAR